MSVTRGLYGSGIKETKVHRYHWVRQDDDRKHSVRIECFCDSKHEADDFMLAVGHKHFATGSPLCHVNGIRSEKTSSSSVAC